MTVEKGISHNNQINSIHRNSTSYQTINYRMCIALNGNGIDFYNSQPAVAEFFLNEERRYCVPDFGTYLKTDFILKFFCKESGL